MDRRPTWINRAWRIGSIALAVGLVLFGGFRLLAGGKAGRAISVSGVEEGEVIEVEVRKGPDLEVVARLGPVENLPRVVHEIEAAASRHSAGSKKITLLDARNPNLSDAYYEMHFQVQEAIATGSFGQLPEKVEGIARGKSINRWEIWIEPDRVFVDLRQGDHYLYEVLPRTHPGQQARV